MEEGREVIEGRGYDSARGRGHVFMLEVEGHDARSRDLKCDRADKADFLPGVPIFGSVRSDKDVYVYSFHLDSEAGRGLLRV